MLCEVDLFTGIAKLVSPFTVTVTISVETVVETDVAAAVETKTSMVCPPMLRSTLFEPGRTMPELELDDDKDSEPGPEPPEPGPDAYMLMAPRALRA